MCRITRLAACSLLLAALLSAGTSPAGANPGSPHSHSGWAQHTILEQFGVTASQVKITIGYTQGYTSVSSPWFISGNCYHSSYPGWTTHFCYYGLTDSSPSNVYGDIWSHMSNTWSLQADYTIRAVFRAGSDNSYSYSCYFDQGSLPPAWDSRCYGGRS